MSERRRLLPAAALCLCIPLCVVCAQTADEMLSLSFDASGSVRQMWSDSEVTALSRGESPVSGIVYSRDNSLIQRKYDGLTRVTEEIVWPAFGAGGPVSVTRYSYRGEDPRPYKSVTETGGERTETDFSDTGLTLAIRTGHADGTQVVTETFAYDKDGRLTLYEKKAPDGTMDITEYIYTKGNEKPDTKYSQNGIVLKEVRYAGNNREEISYFDDGFTVRTLFENGVKTREIYEQNGSVIRTRVF